MVTPFQFLRWLNLRLGSLLRSWWPPWRISWSLRNSGPTSSAGSLGKVTRLHFFYSFFLSVTLETCSSVNVDSERNQTHCVQICRLPGSVVTENWHSPTSSRCLMKVTLTIWTYPKCSPVTRGSTRVLPQTRLERSCVPPRSIWTVSEADERLLTSLFISPNVSYMLLPSRRHDSH